MSDVNSYRLPDNGSDSDNGFVPNFAPMTLEEEALARGWTRTTRPSGPTPAPAPTIGTRGDPDVDNDESYGYGSMPTITDND